MVDDWIYNKNDNGNDIDYNEDNISDDEVVASYEPPRSLLSLFCHAGIIFELI